jgi:carboxymethylenebutenolidase
MDRGTTTSIPCTDGRAMPAEVFSPERGSRAAAAIVMVPPIFGLLDDGRDIAWDYARAGHTVIAPDWFHRTVPGPLKRESPEREKAQARSENFDVEQGLKDIAAALAFARVHGNANGRACVFGYCFGGRFAFLSLTRLGADGAVSFHGVNIGEHLAEADRIRRPFQVHVGDEDHAIAMPEIDATRTALAGNPQARVFLYGGVQHGFTSKGRPSHHLVADTASRHAALGLLSALS